MASGVGAVGAGAGLAKLMGDDDGDEDGAALEKFRKRKKMQDEDC